MSTERLKLNATRASDIVATPPPDSSKALPDHELSWKRIVEIEPRLGAAERLIKTMADKGGRYFCANEFWYGYYDLDYSFKERVNDYTGWFADKPELRSDAAYDIAYEHLYDLLPSCRNCNCA